MEPNDYTGRSALHQTKLHQTEPIHQADYESRSLSSISSRSDINMHHPHARTVWKVMQFFIDFFRATWHRHLVAARYASKRHIIIDTLLRRHRRRFIAKVFINLVFINIFVNTPSLPCPQDGHLASSDRFFLQDATSTTAMTGSRRRHRPPHPRQHDCIDMVSL